MAVLNTLIDDKVDASTLNVDIDLGVTEQESEGSISFILQTQYVPTVVFSVTVKIMNETEHKALMTYLIDNRTKTMKFDVTDYRIDYSGSNLLIANTMTGEVNVRLADRVYNYKTMPNGVQYHETTLKFKIVRNEIL